MPKHAWGVIGIEKAPEERPVPECWGVTAVYPPEIRRTGDDAILKTLPFLWEDIEVHSRPDGRVIPHGLVGEIKVGDIACTTAGSQEWVYLPWDSPAAGYCFVPDGVPCSAY